MTVSPADETSRRLSPPTVLRRAFGAWGLAILLASVSAFAESPESAFQRFDQRAQAGERLSVVFFGGSLTWGAQATDPQLTSYRALVSRRLEDHYPKAHFTFWDAAIGGTGSQLGAFRMERDVFARHPDLVFLDFTVNDGPFAKPNPDRLASYESLIRRLVQKDIPVVPLILAVKKDTLPNAPSRPLDASHKEIAAAYGLPVGDAVTLIQQRVREGSATPDELWPLPDDQTHPGDAGYALYAEAAWQAYEQAVANSLTLRLPEPMLHADTYMTVRRQKISQLGPLPSGWKPGSPQRTAITFDFLPSRWLDEVSIAARPAEGEALPPAPLRLKVKARNILLFGEATPLSGKYEVRVDGGEARTFDAGQMARQGNLRYVETIASDLDPAKEHLVEITPRLEPGQELHLESVCVAGSLAEVSSAPSSSHDSTH